MSAPSQAASSPLIGAAELRDRLGEAFVVDCSHDLASPEAGLRDFEAAHVPGAVHLHLDRDLSGPLGPGSGRHPLPDARRLPSAWQRSACIAGSCWWPTTATSPPTRRVCGG